MDPVDDLEVRLRQAARPGDPAVDRVARAALAVRPRRRVPLWAIPLAALLLGASALVVWRLATPLPRATFDVSVDSSGDVVTLRAPDGTTWLFAGHGTRDLPAGTCLVIAGGSQ